MPCQHLLDDPVFDRRRAPVSITLAAGLLHLLLCGPAVPAAAGLPLEPAAAQAAKARLTVTLPQEEAQVFVNGVEIVGSGASRVFETPPLEPGRLIEYTVVVEWRPNNYTVLTRTRTISVRAGDAVAVDLSRDDPNDRAKVRYVPTPPEIVDKMIELARITPADVVYEPGCGDARVLIAAVRAGARRGVGIDIDPERVGESMRNVADAGLTDRIEIRLGDALDIKDLGNATVVFLYMGNEFNRLIRPILWRQLNVGARIVSHRFTMGDWAPDTTVQVTGADDDTYELHLWTITEAVKKTAGSRAPAAAASPRRRSPRPR